MAIDYPIENGDIFEFTYRQNLDLQTMLNTFHYRWDGATVEDGLSTVLVAGGVFNEEIASAIAAWQADTVVIRPSTVQKIWPVRYVAVNASNDLPATGSLVDAALPTSVSAVIRRKSSIASRHGQGRIFVGGLAITSVEDSQLEVATFNGLTDIALKMVDPIVVGVAGDFTPVIYNRDEPETSLRVATGSVDVVLRNQRRRQVGRGI